MITKEELKEYAKFRAHNLGQAQIDFYQNLLLFILYQEYGKELVFKGGTALAKCYGLNRFSEDLDFTITKELQIEKSLREGLKRYNLNFEIQNKEEFKILIQGPLYSGIRQSLCSIRLDLSTREKIQMETKKVSIKTFTPQIPNFDVIVMDIEEIFAEKVRALLTRTQARDLYDLYMIKEHLCDKKLIETKLALYGRKYLFREVKEAIDNLEKIWDKELRQLIIDVPDFKLVKKTIAGILGGI